MHLGCFPDQSWAIILQQAWSMYLKDRISFNSNSNFNRGSAPICKRKEICQMFNKGLRTAGKNCKYEHKCLECGKSGHGAHICRNKMGAGPTNPSTSQAAGSSGGRIAAQPGK